MIDCHVLVDPCRDASAVLAQLAAEPVNLHIAPARPGRISAARAAAIRAGSAPYVCWVDDDDQIAPGIFSRLLAALEQNPEACGVYCREARVDVSGRVLGVSPPAGWRWSIDDMIDQHPRVHHIAVMRRETVLPLLDAMQRWPMVGDQWLIWMQAQFGPWQLLDEIGYTWRRHAAQVTASATITKELAQAKQDARQRLGLAGN